MAINQPQPWVAVDLDGTLCHFESWQKNCWDLGAPYPRMVARVRALTVAAIPVRIFTARVAATGLENGVGQVDDQAFADRQRAMIEAWCVRHVGQAFAVTATKDFSMIEIWDDRAVSISDGECATPFQVRDRQLYDLADRYIRSETDADGREWIAMMHEMYPRLTS